MSEEDKYDDEENEDSGEGQDDKKDDSEGNDVNEGSEEDQEGSSKLDQFGNYYDYSAKAIKSSQDYFDRGDDILRELAEKGIPNLMPSTSRDVYNDSGYDRDSPFDFLSNKKIESKTISEYLRESKEEPREKRLKRIKKKIHYLGFSPTRKSLGTGRWGFVDEYKDIPGGNWAVKILDPDDLTELQRKYRNLTLEEALFKEAIPLDAQRFNVVPRIVTNTEFMLMPVYSTNLADRLDSGVETTVPKAIEISSKIIRALTYLHIDQERSHSDIKLENIVIDQSNGEEDYLLTDLGNTTFTAEELQSVDPRDNIGDPYFRAPEGFNEGAHPDETSDIYSMGVLMGKLFTGEIFRKDEIDNPEKYTGRLGKLKSKWKKRSFFKKIPEHFRTVVENALNEDSKDRYKNAAELQKDFQKAKLFSEGKGFWSRVNKYGYAFVAGAALLGLYKDTKIEEQREAKEVYSESLDLLRENDRLETARLYLVNKNGVESDDPNLKQLFVENSMEFAIIDQWMDLTQDPKTAMAFYLDRTDTYFAIQEAGGNYDFDSISPIFKKYGSKLDLEITKLFPSDKHLEWILESHAVRDDFQGYAKGHVSKSLDNSEKFYKSLEGKADLYWFMGGQEE